MTIRRTTILAALVAAAALAPWGAAVAVTPGDGTSATTALWSDCDTIRPGAPATDCPPEDGDIDPA